MSLPRQVLPGQFWMITVAVRSDSSCFAPMRRRRTRSSTALRSRRGCSGSSSSTRLPNQITTTPLIFDPGYVSAFVENFHKLVARSQNALRGRWEIFWAAEEPCITRLLDRAAVIDKLIYAASNPVKDGLVERVHQWPGANAYVAFIHGRTLKATRPLHFFRNPGPMPKEVTLSFVIPPELGPSADVIERSREGVSDRNSQRLERQSTGAGVLGRRRAMAQSWKDSPNVDRTAPRGRPRFAGTTEVRVPAIAAYRAFLDAYKRARSRPATWPRRNVSEGHLLAVAVRERRYRIGISAKRLLDRGLRVSGCRAFRNRHDPVHAVRARHAFS